MSRWTFSVKWCTTLVIMVSHDLSWKKCFMYNRDRGAFDESVLYFYCNIFSNMSFLSKHFLLRLRLSVKRVSKRCSVIVWRDGLCECCPSWRHLEVEWEPEKLVKHPNRVWLQTCTCTLRHLHSQHLHSQHLHAQTLALSALARSDTCTLSTCTLRHLPFREWCHLQSFFFFFFFLFIDYFLFESLNILQQ